MFGFVLAMILMLVLILQQVVVLDFDPTVADSIVTTFYVVIAVTHFMLVLFGAYHCLGACCADAMVVPHVERAGLSARKLVVIRQIDGWIDAGGCVCVSESVCERERKGKEKWRSRERDREEQRWSVDETNGVREGCSGAGVSERESKAEAE